MNRYLRALLLLSVLFIANHASAQLSCASSLPAQNLLTTTQGFFTDTNSATTLTSNVSLTTTKANFARDGSNLVMVFVAGWNDGNPAATSPRATVTLLVNGTPYFQMVTPINNGTTAVGTALNSAVTSPTSGFTIAEGFYSYNQTVTLTLPSTVTQLQTITQAFISNTAANSDDGGFQFTAAYACPIAANLSVAKTNGVNTLTAGVTTSYTVTFANSGTFAANNAVIKDTPGTGLSNCSATCSGTLGGAVCPTTPANMLTGSGTTIPTFPANSTVNLIVTCGVTATGL